MFKFIKFFLFYFIICTCAFNAISQISVGEIHSTDSITLVCKPSNGLSVSEDPWLYRNEKTGEYFLRVVWGDWPTYCRAHEGKVFDIYLGNKEDAIKSITQFDEISKQLKKGEFINFQDSHKHNFQFYRVDNVVYERFGFIDCDSELVNDFGVNKGKPIANVIHEKSFEKLLKKIDKWK